mgnify:CR=1 FL=1
MNRIVIKVWRGLVSEVYASDANTEVIVIDEDCDEVLLADTDLPAHQVY